VRTQRQQVLAAAYAAHPERFVNGRPHPADLPTAVWINSPPKKTTAQDAPRTTIVTSDDLGVDLISDVRIDRSATLITSPLVSQCR
jgi:putative transposase